MMLSDNIHPLTHATVRKFIHYVPSFVRVATQNSTSRKIFEHLHCCRYVLSAFY